MEVYTVKEVAEKLQVHIGTVWNYIKSGKLKAAKFGNRYRISEQQLQEFFNSMTTDSKEQDTND